MKTIIAIIASFALSSTAASASILDTLIDQTITQTKVTITEKGGPASLYDMSQGRSSALRVGFISHALTNRFLNADLGWFGGTDGHVDGLLVGGPSVRIDEMIAYYSPSIASAASTILPDVLQKFYIGASCGWGTDNGAFHYGFHLGYDFK